MGKIRAAMVSLALVSIAPRAEAQDASLAGYVREAPSLRAVPAMTVRLLAPPGARQPEMLTLTNVQGQFRFSSLSPGSYMLEVLQGTHVVSREIVEVSGEATKDVIVRRVP
ncbi:carboxypeptidase-like regulatory domain-containing protein [Polyangium mundeleinium]|uniref:Carboxypeptidase-like regulatory domain-containing protein n=1 Tax=Polyangium mundeleinium TaxID=2995306 RepID=A0ABT5F2R5_9BACT|nr:carboxypeptidase-like regulatory domain-containing protein [Polyangium mundeleinium]MDC0747909.1 carboxypeptidase-like regulatory domain-containing protein [Polyangium mundeleinium]